MTIFVTYYQPVLMEYQRLGDHIREVNIRNRELRVTAPMGINIDKYFMPSVANVIGTDLSNYKLVSKLQFACNLMHVGRDEKIPMAMLTDEAPIIVSPAYFVFEVSKPDILLPDYLMMWFRRPEFDRNAWFYTDSDVRGGMSKAALLDMQLPVPPIERQREIVAEYETLTRRIRLNEQIIQRLEDTAQALYRNTFIDNIDKQNLPPGWHFATIERLADIKNGKALVPSKGNIPIYGGNGIIGYTDCPNAEDIIVIGRVGINCGSLFLHQGKCYVNDNAMIAKPKDKNLIFLFWTLKHLNLNSQSEGSGQPLLTQSIIYNQVCFIPEPSLRDSFENQALKLYNNKLIIENETEILTELQSLLLAKMGQ